MGRFFLPLLFATITLATPGVSADEFSLSAEKLAQYTAEAKRWDAVVASFEKQDSENTYPENSILFIGSSTFAGWKTMAEDMAPFKVINRGYGGAKWSDHRVLVNRIIKNQGKVQGIVLYSGNDIATDPNSKSADEVLLLVKETIALVRKKYPKTPIFLLGHRIIPLWIDNEAVRLEVNQKLKKLCATNKSLTFVGVESLFMKADRTPRLELYHGDKIHLNEQGQYLMAAALKTHFQQVLDYPAVATPDSN